MSISVHFNAYNQKGLTGGVQAHQERFSESEALHALQNTKSHIDPSETKYNICLFRDELLKTKTVKQVAKELTDQFQAKRVEMGLKRKRKDFKTMMVGTFQFSDDTLELMGYDKAKKWSENTEQARDIVSKVYNQLVSNALVKPEYYGRVMTATLHVDESTPHVDFMSIGVDPEKPNYGVREILNGVETKDNKTGKRIYEGKGVALRRIQDDLSKAFDSLEQSLKWSKGVKEAIIKRYDLVRGRGTSKNIAKGQALRKVWKEEDKRLAKERKKLDEERERLARVDDSQTQKFNDILAREEALNSVNKRLKQREEDIEAKELKLASKASEVDSREVRLEEAKKEAEKRFDKREQELSRREFTLNDKDKALSGLKSKVESLESENSILRERVIRFEGRYEYAESAKTAQHMYYRTEYLKEQAQKRPQMPRQQTKDYGYGR